MFILYSRLLSRLDSIEQRLAQDGKETDAEPAPDTTPEPDPQTLLNHIAEVSKNARATWFGLLGLLAFVGVTLLAHKDADFFAWGAETQLPLIGIKVPVKAFFIFAPLLVAALYTYLHLYLMNLWDALADLKQEQSATPIADRVYPWLISHAALWYRNRVRGDNCTAPRALGWVVVTVSVMLGWLFGILVLGGLWLRSMPAHNEGLTLWIALCLLAATSVGLTGFMAARARMREKSRETVAGAHKGRRWLGAVLAVLLAFLSWETTEGSGILTWTKTNDPVLLYPADLSEAELTRKPPGCLPWHLWNEDFEEKFRKRKGIEPGTDLTTGQETDFEKEAKERYAEYISQLAAPDLKDADLRNANMLRAFLPGADLREVKMQGADLFRAKMQGADCSSATLRGALLQSAFVTCNENTLTQDQLEQAVGDSETVLPDGLTVASCLETLPGDAEDALAHHPEEADPFRSSRQQVRDALLCSPGEEPVRIPDIATDQQ